MQRREREATFPFPVVRPPQWQQTAVAALADGDLGGDWSTYNIRQFIDQASISITGGSKIRITFKAAAGGAFNTSKVYCGQASATWSTSAPNYASAPTEVKFGGASGFSLAAAAADLVSDDILISAPTSNGLCVSWKGAGVMFMPGGSTTPTNWQKSDFFGADQSGNTTVTGTWPSSGSTAHVSGVKKVEVFI